MIYINEYSRIWNYISDRVQLFYLYYSWLSFVLVSVPVWFENWTVLIGSTSTPAFCRANTLHLFPVYWIIIISQPYFFIDKRKVDWCDCSLLPTYPWHTHDWRERTWVSIGLAFSNKQSVPNSKIEVFGSKYPTRSLKPSRCLLEHLSFWIHALRASAAHKLDGFTQ